MKSSLSIWHYVVSVKAALKILSIFVLSLLIENMNIIFILPNLNVENKPKMLGNYFSKLQVYLGDLFIHLFQFTLNQHV